MTLPEPYDLLPDLCDDHLEQLSICAPLFHDFGGRKTFSGQVVTLRCFEDNSLVRDLVAEEGRGKVLVIDGAGSVRRALLGDQLAEKALANGWEGVVINGAVRDVVTLGAMALGVKALAACPVKTEKRGQGERDVVVTVAGVIIHPGDMLYADPNGVAVSREPLATQN